MPYILFVLYGHRTPSAVAEVSYPALDIFTVQADANPSHSGNEERVLSDLGVRPNWHACMLHIWGNLGISFKHVGGGGSLPAPLLNINLLPVRLMEILRTFSDVGDGLEHTWSLSMHASYSVWLAGQIKYCPNWPLVTRSDTVS